MESFSQVGEALMGSTLFAQMLVEFFPSVLSSRLIPNSISVNQNAKVLLSYSQNALVTRFYLSSP